MSEAQRRNTDRPKPDLRAAYAQLVTMSTRWADNDVYGHVNNTVYYQWFDTAVNEVLIREGAIDIESGDVIGLVVDTQCSFFAPVSFPDRISVGIKAVRSGSTSVRYRLAVFRDDAREACAQGHFVHVYVDRVTRRPVALPELLRAVVEKLMI
jgi:acyl-CoA thioester hydrolase